MKLFAPLFIAIFAATSVFSQESTEKSEKHFGAVLNSSITFSEGFISISPTAMYYHNRHQFELGFGLIIGQGDKNRKITTNFNYKFFPSGLTKRINLYAAADLSYYNLYDNSFQNGSEFIGSYFNQVSLFGGCGAQVKFLGNAYFGIGLYLGTSTFESGYDFGNAPQSGPRLFEAYEFDGAVKVNVGYRF